MPTALGTVPPPWVRTRRSMTDGYCARLARRPEFTSNGWGAADAPAVMCATALAENPYAENFTLAAGATERGSDIPCPHPGQDSDFAR